ncbi:inovirus-type Gp2 protein [Halomonas aquamarina]|uniref:Inovirus-type Gp2 protein n=1 Tax=Vreelandella aquamarina TaxID=77097 RepID=A0ACC5VUC6_9GAMM|nr:inovirus-type Gp2 protein [Halomonas aquamarina]
MTLEDHKGLIARFIASLKAIIKHDRESKRKAGWVPDTKVHYVWCREIGRNGKPHYHFFFLLNRDAYYMPGKAASQKRTLSAGCHVLGTARWESLGTLKSHGYTYLITRTTGSTEVT